MISVVVPVYNVEKYIVKCLESIVNQTYKDYELIIVDDGSTDNTVNVIRNYLESINFHYYLYLKENGGQSSSRNFGLKKSTGDYIVFIDSDDIISDDFLSELYISIIKNNADFSFCNYEFVSQQSPPIDNNNKHILLNKENLLKLFLKRTIDFVVPSMLFKKNFLIDNNIWFDERISFSEDQLFIWNVLFKIKKAVYLNKKMYGYFVREKSIMTGSPYKRILNGFDIYKESVKAMSDNYPEYKSIISLILPRWELGTLYSASKLVSYEEFIDLYNKMDGKTLFKRNLRIKEIKSIGLSFISFCIL